MITQERLKYFLRFEPESGVFIRSISRPGHIAGSVAGCTKTNKNGKRYRTIYVDGAPYYAHRLAWLYVYGEFPSGEVDHINGDGTDNRMENLRDVTKHENCKNIRLRKDNKSGVCGLFFIEESGRWRASIFGNGKMRHIGCYKYKFDAICARKSAENLYGFHQNHGQDRPL
jgi:hypothetical protein